MSELNIELLKQVRDKIAATPQAYDQTTWAAPSPLAPCGTAACIAGWACLLSGAMSAKELYRIGQDYDPDGVIQATAANHLGINDREAEILFDGDPGESWPSFFRYEWREAEDENYELQTSPEQANVAVRYLDHIIETGSVLE